MWIASVVSSQERIELDCFSCVSLMTEIEFLEALVGAIARLVETLRTTSRNLIVWAFFTASWDPRELARPTEEVKLL